MSRTDKPAMTLEEMLSRADFDMVEVNALPRRPPPLPGGERSDRACAIRVRGKRPNNRLRSPLTRNVRAKRAHSDLSPPGRGESSRSTLSENALNADARPAAGHTQTPRLKIVRQRSRPSTFSLRVLIFSSMPLRRG